MRRKELSDEQVRITVRLPAALYEAVMDRRRFRHTGGNDLSQIVRKALEHTLGCPERLREEEAARMAAEQRMAASEAERTATLAADQAACEAREAEEAAHQERRAAFARHRAALQARPYDSVGEEVEQL